MRLVEDLVNAAYAAGQYGGQDESVEQPRAALERYIRGLQGSNNSKRQRIKKLTAGIREVLAYLPDSGDDPACNIEDILQRTLQP